MDKPIQLPPAEAYALWAADYDHTPNALLALEERCLGPLLDDKHGQRVIDVACGTGRWLQRLAESGANAVGVDITRAMLQLAIAKPHMAGRCAKADARRLPFSGGSAHVVLTSFLLGYLPDPRPLFDELARVTRTNGLVLAAEIHPDAIRSGWRRTFRHGDHVYEPKHYPHTFDDISQAAELTRVLELEAHLSHHFEEPERALFEQAGRHDFDEIRKTPAIWIGVWRRKP